MKLRILKKHFDAAVKQPFQPNTCLIAQAFIAVGMEGNCANDDLTWKAQALQDTFDKNFRRPGDEKKPALKKLRASLPITVEIP